MVALIENFPLSAILLLHYAFDRWMAAQFPKVPFCRYAEDGLIHCRSLRQAHYLKKRLADRLKECGLELHPDKTKVVSCPNCGKPVPWAEASRWRPFCSERCRLIDLGEWFAENRKLPGDSPQED